MQDADEGLQVRSDRVGHNQTLLDNGFQTVPRSQTPAAGPNCNLGLSSTHRIG